MHNPQCLAETHLRADQSMLRIKICGITRISDALDTVDAGADAIGLNFYPESKRYVTPATAQQIVAAVGDSVACVGVFVNSPASEVNSIAETLGLDWVQLHGNEPPEFLIQIGEKLKVLRVYRVGPEGMAPVIADLAACESAGKLPNAILIDSAVPGEYGGTGQKVSELFLARDKINSSDLFSSLPVILAGGLTPENVAESILQSRPDGVDVASGVESAPGIKDPALIKSFVTEARQALG
ncbi:phosphoribosylanthranilate isomerase [Bythopirellula polymerisocia]|uniref:N-(5'-phosphoribosyl)anthranilate isomerase n=1 Tax=Bythopirellula polymerisocia TaxID=2528003 RepID=A0A5C6CY70_9BACT|nr:phosphoribosylanthranilate isomerase [Bythopirellula polymerisocia]TWU28431.1 N-(5'-phosphoribosyl)anthranilate isomerase [Bythopirellula polymerisocia]